MGLGLTTLTALPNVRHISYQTLRSIDESMNEFVPPRDSHFKLTSYFEKSLRGLRHSSIVSLVLEIMLIWKI